MTGILRKFCAVLALFVLITPALAAERTVVVVMFDGFPPAMIDATTTISLI